MGGGRRPDFFIFVVWSALIVGGWVVVAWRKKSYLGLAEIAAMGWGEADGLIFLFL